MYILLADFPFVNLDISWLYLVSFKKIRKLLLITYLLLGTSRGGLVGLAYGLLTYEQGAKGGPGCKRGGQLKHFAVLLYLHDFLPNQKP